MESQKFSKKINDFPAPRATICIGGNSKHHKLTKENHFNHIQTAKSLIKQGFSVFITTSRRTPRWVMEEYKELSDEVMNQSGDILEKGRTLITPF